MTTAAQAVEIALRGVILTEEEADRLRTLIASRVRPATARERLSEYLEQAVMPTPVRENVRRFVRAALADQASKAIAAADTARREVGLKSSAEHVYEAVRQALLTDEGDR